MSYGQGGRTNYWAPGEFNAVCYFCGFKYKSGEMKRYWQGFYTCQTCWEPRQPQDFVRAIADNQTAPWQQPITYTYAYFCSQNDTSCYAGTAVAGCARAGYRSPMFVLPT